MSGTECRPDENNEISDIRARRSGVGGYSGHGEEVAMTVSLSKHRTSKPIIFTTTPNGQDIARATNGAAGYVMAGSLLRQPG